MNFKQYFIESFDTKVEWKEDGKSTNYVKTDRYYGEYDEKYEQELGTETSESYVTRIPTESGAVWYDLHVVIGKINSYEEDDDFDKLEDYASIFIEINPSGVSWLTQPKKSEIKSSEDHLDMMKKHKEEVLGKLGSENSYYNSYYTQKQENGMTGHEQSIKRIQDKIEKIKKLQYQKSSNKIIGAIANLIIDKCKDTPYIIFPYQNIHHRNETQKLVRKIAEKLGFFEFHNTKDDAKVANDLGLEYLFFGEYYDAFTKIPQSVKHVLGKNNPLADIEDIEDESLNY